MAPIVTRTRMGLIVALAAAAVVSACGGSNSSNAPAQSQAPMTSAPATSAPTTSHPLAGTRFDGEGIAGAAAQQLQQSVDAGHQPWRLDQASVARAFVRNRFNWQLDSVAFGRPNIAFVTNAAGGSRVELHLTQPAKQGNGGIWVVDYGIWD
ncbi:hypothetical protein FOS14_03530 [Skermania sp. ID1734]|uniref:hypothetical protein n=1 Tax=Skermania sp. ID1734 TaxID=2597516 RepID=UPI00117C1731|nr:hypothetical protein [Skermania sp. ID1734]TSE01614.1 hypothetical protein FOS14_03530 [Skermania sp. ID1734]